MSGRLEIQGGSMPNRQGPQGHSGHRPTFVKTRRVGIAHQWGSIQDKRVPIALGVITGVGVGVGIGIEG
jgi:hypothetical protein